MDYARNVDEGEFVLFLIKRRVAVPTNKEERDSDACESVSRQVTD